MQTTRVPPNPKEHHLDPKMYWVSGSWTCALRFRDSYLLHGVAFVMLLMCSLCVRDVVVVAVVTLVGAVAIPGRRIS